MHWESERWKPYWLGKICVGYQHDTRKWQPPVCWSRRQHREGSSRPAENFIIVRFQKIRCTLFAISIFALRLQRRSKTSRLPALVALVKAVSRPLPRKNHNRSPDSLDKPLNWITTLWISAFAFFSSRSWTISTCPHSAASFKLVDPTSFWWLMFDPPCNNRSTTAVCPFSLARRSGMSPS